MKITLNGLESLTKKGVYCIKNTLNDKIYIGSTTDSFKRRLTQHIRKLKSKNHHNIYLQNSINKYGFENFEFLILETIEDLTTIRIREKYFIDFYKSANSKNGYNISNETHKPPINQDIRDKISATIKKKYKEDLQYIENNRKGKEKRKGIPTWNKGLKCDNISDARKEMFGDIEVYDINMKYFRTFDNCVEIEKFGKSDFNDLPIINNKRGGYLTNQNIHRAIRENKFYKGLFFKKVPRGTINING